MWLDVSYNMKWRTQGSVRNLNAFSFVHSRISHCTLVSFHTKLSFFTCPCFQYLYLSDDAGSILLLTLSIFLYVFTFFLFRLVPILGRLCKKLDETLEHVILTCPILATEQYIKRHDRVCAEVHFNLCKEIGVKLHHKHWYENVPKLIETGLEVKVTIVWNQQYELTELFLTIQRTS